jgi:hypothetical protein
MNTPSRRGQARAIAEQIERAQRDETIGALVTAFALRAIRDRSLYTALGAKTLASAIEARLPALDRISIRSFLILADAFIEVPPATLVPITVAKLLHIARTPLENRAEMLAAGTLLPAGEMARQVRELTDRAAAIALRTALNDPPTEARLQAAREVLPQDPAATLSAQEKVLLATTLLGDVEGGWADMGSAAFEIGRLLALLRDQNLAYLLYRDGEDEHASLADTAVDTFGMSIAELERSLALADNLALLPLAERRRIGLRALREIATIVDPARREAALARARAEELAGESAMALAKEAQNAPPALATTADGPGPAGSWTDDPARLAPYNLIFLPDARSAGSSFADATPEALIEQILMRTTRPGDEVLDLTAGSGSVAIVATRMGRHVTSVDRLDPPMIPGIEVGDARHWTPATAQRYALVIFHPPIPGETRYSERYTGTSLRGDLSLLDPEAFGHACAEVFRHVNRELLDKNGRLVIIGHESRAFGGRFIDWPGKLSLVAEKVDLAPLDRIYAVSGPEGRRALERSVGFRARRENRTIPVVTSAIIVGRAEARR